MDYRKILTDHRWKEKEERILRRDERVCSNPDHVNDRRRPEPVRAQLEVGIGCDALPWEYSDDHFQTLCEECHRDVESPHRSSRYTKRHLTLGPKFSRMSNDEILSLFVPRHSCPWTQRDDLRLLLGGLGEALDLFHGISRQEKMLAVMRYIMALLPLEEELLDILHDKGAKR